MSDENEIIKDLLIHLRTWLNRDETRDRYRINTRAFTRQRKLTFERVSVLLLQGAKMAIQQRLNRFFKALGQTQDVVTAGAFCQARQNLRPEVFLALNREITQFFYERLEDTRAIKRWQGHRLVAIDGSVLNLPNTAETRERFGVQANQSEQTWVQALTSYCYDVLNEVLLNASIDSLQAEKEFIFDQHAQHWHPDDVVVYDRNYADYSVMAYHVLTGRPFVIRCPLTQSFKAVTELVASPLTDTQVTLHVTRRQREFVFTTGLPREIQVRLVKVRLPDGSWEVLMTSLLCPERYPQSAFGWLYQQRWGVETFLNHFKNQLDVERFSALKLRGILQDFYARAALATLEGVLSQLDNQHIQTTSRQANFKHVYKINKAVVAQTVGDHLIELLLDPHRPLTDVVADLRHLFYFAKVPIRPNRSFPRKKATPQRQLRFLRYEKRLYA